MAKKKKRIISVALVMFLLIALSVVFVVVSNFSPKVMSLSAEGLPTEGVNLIAHRGFSAVAPENSKSAFIEAGKAKFFAAECDVHLSKDNVWVVNHNETIDVMTDGKGKIYEMTYEEISKYSIDKGNNWKDFDKQSLITLDDFLAVCSEYDIVPQIEIKEGNYEQLDSILVALDKYDGMREKAIIISFDGVILEKLRNLDADLKLWYLTDEIDHKAVVLASMNNYTIGFNCKKYDKEMIKKAQEQNIELATWTVDDPKLYKELYDLGVRNFTTNCLTY